MYDRIVGLNLQRLTSGGKRLFLITERPLRNRQVHPRIGIAGVRRHRLPRYSKRLVNVAELVQPPAKVR